MLFFNTIYTFLKDERYRDLLLTAGFTISVGTVVYHYLEGWTWLDSFYFSLITLTTIGFGDFAPTTQGGKIFTIFYVIVGIGIILSFVNAIYLHYDNLNEEKRRLKQKKRDSDDYLS